MLKFHSINNFRCMVDIFNMIFLYCFNRILVLFQKFQLSVGLLLLFIAAASAEEQVVAQLQLRNFSISRSAYSQIESGTYNIRIRACLKIHSRHLHSPLCAIFALNSGYIARYAPLIWHKSPTNCGIHLSESNFQTRSSELIALTEIFRTDYNTIFDGLTYRK